MYVFGPKTDFFRFQKNDPFYIFLTHFLDIRSRKVRKNRQKVVSKKGQKRVIFGSFLTLFWPFLTLFWTLILGTTVYWWLYIIIYPYPRPVYWVGSWHGRRVKKGDLAKMTKKHPILVIFGYPHVCSFYSVYLRHYVILGVWMCPEGVKKWSKKVIFGSFLAIFGPFLTTFGQVRTPSG